MTTLEARTRTTRPQVPATLSPTGKLVYVFLAAHGRATAEDLKSALGVPQIRLYPVLDALERHGLVRRTGEEFSVDR